MSETERIWNQLQRSFEGNDAWNCPSLRDLLAAVTAEQAHAHPIPGAPSICTHQLDVRANVLRADGPLNPFHRRLATSRGQGPRAFHHHAAARAKGGLGRAMTPRRSTIASRSASASPVASPVSEPSVASASSVRATS